MSSRLRILLGLLVLTALSAGGYLWYSARPSADVNSETFNQQQEAIFNQYIPNVCDFANQRPAYTYAKDTAEAISSVYNFDSNNWTTITRPLGRTWVADLNWGAISSPVEFGSTLTAATQPSSLSPDISYFNPPLNTTLDIPRQFELLSQDGDVVNNEYSEPIRVSKNNGYVSWTGRAVHRMPGGTKSWFQGERTMWESIGYSATHVAGTGAGWAEYLVIDNTTQPILRMTKKVIDGRLQLFRYADDQTLNKLPLRFELQNGLISSGTLPDDPLGPLIQILRTVNNIHKPVREVKTDNSISGAKVSRPLDIETEFLDADPAVTEETVSLRADTTNLCKRASNLIATVQYLDSQITQSLVLDDPDREAASDTQLNQINVNISSGAAGVSDIKISLNLFEDIDGSYTPLIGSTPTNLTPLTQEGYTLNTDQNGNAPFYVRFKAGSYAEPKAKFTYLSGSEDMKRETVKLSKLGVKIRLYTHLIPSVTSQAPIWVPEYGSGEVIESDRIDLRVELDNTRGNQPLTGRLLISPLPPEFVLTDDGPRGSSGGQVVDDNKFVWSQVEVPAGVNVERYVSFAYRCPEADQAQDDSSVCPADKPIQHLPITATFLNKTSGKITLLGYYKPKPYLDCTLGVIVNEYSPIDDNDNPGDDRTPCDPKNLINWPKINRMDVQIAIDNNTKTRSIPVQIFYEMPAKIAVLITFDPPGEITIDGQKVTWKETILDPGTKQIKMLSLVHKSASAG